MMYMTCPAPRRAERELKEPMLSQSLGVNKWTSLCPPPPLKMACLMHGVPSKSFPKKLSTRTAPTS